MATLQLLSSSAGIQETSVALYNNFEQLKSNAIIVNQNKDNKHTVNTVIKACPKSDSCKIVSAYNINERLIKFDLTSAIQAQLDHVNNNYEQLKSTFYHKQVEEKQWKWHKYIFKRRLIRGSVSV